MQLSKRKNVLIVIISIILLLGALFLYLKTTSEKRALEVPESNTIPLDSPATLLNSEDVYKNLEINQYEQFRNDLTNYARNYAGVSDNVITYEVDGSVISGENNLKFKVISNNSPQHSIAVILEKKPYQRIYLSFTDIQKGGSDYDSRLYSNSQRNVFVSTLPIQNINYSIDYNQQEDKFLIYLYDKSESIRQSAINEIAVGSGLENIDVSQYDITAPGVFEDNWIGTDVNETEGD